MANQFQDLNPPPRRSIRDIPIPEGRRPRPDMSPPVAPPPPSSRPRKEEMRRRPAASPPPRPESPPGRAPINPDPFIPNRGERDPYWRAGLWILVFIALIFLFFGISYLFAGADIKVTPVSQQVSVNQTIEATEDGAGGTLPYSVITLEKDEQVPVTSNGSQNVSEKASGEIIVYNNYSASSQALIATTRFETPEGLIYRINKDITVPGEVTVNGQTTPGSIEATVYADQPGEEYNVGLKDFTIPGFQGTAKYQGFYARSKTALAGGFVGVEKTVSPTDLSNAQAKIQSDLTAQFLAQANSQKPDDFILYPNAITTSFTAEPNATGTAQNVLVGESGTANVVVINRDALTSYLENNIVSTTTGTSTLMGLDNLTFSFSNPNGFNPGTGSSTSFSFNLKGNLQLVSVVDNDKLKNDLRGASRSSLSSVLANYPSIQKAEVIFKPFWRWSFPDNVANIKVEIENPQ